MRERANPVRRVSPSRPRTLPEPPESAMMPAGNRRCPTTESGSSLRARTTPEVSRSVINGVPRSLLPRVALSNESRRTVSDTAPTNRPRSSGMARTRTTTHGRSLSVIERRISPTTSPRVFRTTVKYPRFANARAESPGGPNERAAAIRVPAVSSRKRFETGDGASASVRTSARLFVSLCDGSTERVAARLTSSASAVRMRSSMRAAATVAARSTSLLSIVRS